MHEAGGSIPPGSTMSDTQDFDIITVWPEHAGHLIVLYETVCTPQRPLTMVRDDEEPGWLISSSQDYIDQNPITDNGYQFGEDEESEPAAPYTPVHGLETGPGQPWAYPVIVHQEFACLTCGVTLPTQEPDEDGGSEITVSFTFGTYEPDLEFIAQDITHRLSTGGWCNWLSGMRFTGR